MEQRRLRLGDILDDYCPRERRVTNHAIVAMIEEDVKQTRCTTCDAEHAYKGARVPRRRKKETPAALYKEVLAGMPDVEDAPVLAAAIPAAALAVSGGGLAIPSIDALPGVVEAIAAPVPGKPEPLAAKPVKDVQPPMQSEDMKESPAVAERGVADASEQVDVRAEYRDDVEDSPAGVVDGPVHRPLIRATLPRIEGQKDARPVPEFTVRHAPGGRGNGQGSSHGGFRGDRMRMREGRGNGNGNSHGAPNGNRAQGGGGRFHGNRPSGQGRQASGRSGGGGNFRGGNNGPKRGRSR